MSCCRAGLTADFAIGIMAGQAECAIRAVYDEEVECDRVFGLDVRVVARSAFHAAIHHGHRAGGVVGVMVCGKR